MLRHPSRYVCIPDGASISLSCQMKSFIVFVIFTRHGLEDSAFETSKIYISLNVYFFQPENVSIDIFIVWRKLNSFPTTFKYINSRGNI